MKRMRENDFDIIEAVQQAPEKGMHFAALVQRGFEPKRLHHVLKRLIASDYLTERHGAQGAYYCITEANQVMNIQRVICPVCKTIRRTHREDQHAIHCKNPECKTPSGRHRTFWLVNIDHFRKGVIRKINYAN